MASDPASNFTGLALATIPMAIIARMTRSSMLEVMRSDYVRTARAKGTKNVLGCL